MKLAIGDVVRISRENALGTVAGLGAGAVVIRLNGQDVRTAHPTEIEMVARAFKPSTPSNEVATLLFVALGLIVGVLHGFTIGQLGGGMLLVAAGAVAVGATTVNVLLGVFLRPRRLRV